MMQKKIYAVIIPLLFFLLTTTLYAATIEFWTTETQSDRVKTIRLLMDTFEALNPDIAMKFNKTLLSEYTILKLSFQCC